MTAPTHSGNPLDFTTPVAASFCCMKTAALTFRHHRLLMPRTRSLVMTGLALLSAGCATMFTGNYDNVVVRSNPPGATVSINGSYKGTTPMVIALKRDRDHLISLHREGHPDAVRPVSRKFNPVAAVNLINPICWGIDYATGGMWQFRETAFEVDMSSRGADVAP